MKWTKSSQICPVIRLLIFAGSCCLSFVLGTYTAGLPAKPVQRLDFEIQQESLLRAKRNPVTHPPDIGVVAHKLVDDKTHSVLNSGPSPDNFRSLSSTVIDSTTLSTNIPTKQELSSHAATTTTNRDPIFTSSQNSNSNETSTLLTKLSPTQIVRQEILFNDGLTTPQSDLRELNPKRSGLLPTTVQNTSIETKHSNSNQTATVTQMSDRTTASVVSSSEFNFTDSSLQESAENVTEVSNSVSSSSNSSTVSISVSSTLTTWFTNQWLSNVSSVLSSTKGPTVDHILPPLLPSNSADSIASQPTVESVGGVSATLGLGLTIGIIFGVIAVFILLAGFFGFVIYHKRLRSLSEIKYPTDNCGYVDDSLRVSYMNSHIELPKENPEEMFSLDNDSFLNSLEAMTLQNYWAEDAKNTKV